MEKKKLLLLLAVLMGVCLASIYLLSRGYGDSYSERQRRVHNRMLTKGTPRFLPDLYVEEPLTKAVRPDLGKSDREEFSRNSFHANLNWPENTGSEVQSVSVRGMTDWELKECMKAGNMDAALEYMVRHPNKQNRPCLLMVVRSGRPGAKEVLDILDKSKWKGIRDIELLLAKKIVIQELQDGSMYFYRLFDGRFRSEALAALKPLAEKGDLVAMRNYGEIMLQFDEKDNHAENTDWCRAIYEESNFREWTAVLPAWVPVRRYSWSKTMGEVIQAERYLRTAAEAGDLDARYLWMEAGFPILGFQEKATWELAQTCLDDLSRKGYRRICLDVFFQRAWGLGSFSSQWGNLFFRNGYKQEMPQEVRCEHEQYRARLGRHLADRGDGEALERQIREFDWETGNWEEGKRLLLKMAKMVPNHFRDYHLWYVNEYAGRKDKDRKLEKLLLECLNVAVEAEEAYMKAGLPHFPDKMGTSHSAPVPEKP